MDDQTALRKLFKFDDNDLAANRNGKFSAQQAQARVKSLQANTKFGIIFGSIALVIAILLLLLSIPPINILGPAGYIFCVICAGFAFLGLRSGFNTRKADISKDVGIVKKVQGPIRIQYGKGMDIYLHVKGETWEIDQDCADSITEGDTYAIYLGGRNRDILSIEWIAKGSS